MKEESIYRDLPNLEETIIESVIQTSLTETSMSRPNGSSVFATTSGTDVLTEVATI